MVKTEALNRFLQSVRERRLLLALLVVFLPLIIFISCNLLAPDTDRRIEAMRKKGYPVTLAELDSWYTKLPAADNVALLYQNAFASLSAVRDLGESFNAKKKRLRRKEGLSSEDRTEMESIVQTNQAALALLHAIRPGHSRYPIDLSLGYATLLPHLAKLRQAVQLLCVEALLKEDKGEDDKAIDSMTAAAQAAESLKDEPTLISQLVRFASWSLVASGLEQVLSITNLSDAQLTALQHTFSHGENPGALNRGLGAEQAFGIAVFTDVRQQVNVLSGGPGNGGTTSDVLRIRLLIGLAKATGIVRRDRNFFLGAMATNIAAAELPYPQRLEAGRRAGGNLPPSRFYFISSMLLPALSKAVERDADLTAQIRAAETGLAIERYRLAHQGALPDTLADLAPSFIAAVPFDPYDGQPLRFKRLSKGYVVYSIGSDGRDDGGLEADPNNRNKGHDVTFTVEK